MSLIHDALKSMDAPAASPTLRARAPATAARARPAWLDAMLAFVIVVGAGVVGWFVWQSQVKPRAALLPVAMAPAQPAPQTIVVTAPVPAPLDSSAAPATMPLPPVAVGAAVMPDTPQPITVPQAAPVNVALQPAARVTAPAPSTYRAPAPAFSGESNTAPASVAQSNPRPARERPVYANSGTGTRPVDQALSVPAPGPVAPPAPAVVDDTPVELRFSRFVAAMKDGRGADAERELAALKERLPSGSLGLMRAQAWYDLRAGRDAAAAAGYRAILDRLPGDEEAAVNLASIQARQQKPEEARATLDAAVRIHPDSAALRSALAQFTPAAR